MVLFLSLMCKSGFSLHARSSCQNASVERSEAPRGSCAEVQGSINFLLLQMLREQAYLCTAYSSFRPWAYRIIPIKVKQFEAKLSKGAFHVPGLQGDRVPAASALQSLENHTCSKMQRHTVYARNLVCRCEPHGAESRRPLQKA